MLTDSDREEVIADAGSRETYLLQLLEDIRGSLQGHSASAAGTVETISSYKSLPEQSCRRVVLYNAAENLLRWRLSGQSGTGNPLRPGDTITIPADNASDIEVRGQKTGMEVVWVAS